MIDKLFMWGVHTIQWLEVISGLSYEWWNVFLFIILQPLLILLFMILYLLKINEIKNINQNFWLVRRSK